MKLTSTRMNGVSTWSLWPSHAPYPSASSRRSRSSSGVNDSYQAIDLSMSATGRAMCVQRIDGGWMAYLSTTSLTGPPLRDDRIRPALGPQDQRVAPRIEERAVEPVELGPVVLAPELGRPEPHGRVEDPLVVVVVGHEDPDPRGAAVAAELAWIGARRVRMRPGVGHVVDAHV